MAERFFDTSAAAKHYRSEVGTASVDAFLGETGSTHYLSALSSVELHSILARLVRTGQISAAAFHLTRSRFLADITTGLWQILPVTNLHWQSAQQLIVAYGTTRSLRTLDAVQLAVALTQHATTPLDGFVCADHALCQIATASGLQGINPEIP